MISCKDISFSYDGKVPTLSNITLDIADGEFLCILGGNGSGKSTLAKHLNALLVPDSGSVEVDGLNTSDPQLVYDVRSRVGMVFQNPDDQLVGHARGKRYCLWTRKPGRPHKRAFAARGRTPLASRGPHGL